MRYLTKAMLLYNNIMMYTDNPPLYCKTVQHASDKVLNIELSKVSPRL